MSILRAAFLVAVLAAPAAAPTAGLAAQSDGVSVALTLADALISRRPLLVDDAVPSASATQSYFDYDALLTLAALAVAGGGLAAWGRRSGVRAAAARNDDGPARWIQADLAHRVAHPRDAA